MGGWGSFPADLFLYLGERYASNAAGLKKEMHLLWTITIKRPGYKRIVHHTLNKRRGGREGHI